MNKDKTYYIGGGDYFGKNEASKMFHKEMLPLLTKLKISGKNIDKIANIVSEIYDLAYSDGYDNAIHEVNEYN